MCKKESIPEILDRIAILLSKFGDDTWARACRSHSANFAYNPEETKARIRSMYGGMGSFNDLILHSEDASAPIEENNELDQLKGMLYQMCMPCSS